MSRSSSMALISLTLASAGGLLAVHMIGCSLLIKGDLDRNLGACRDIDSTCACDTETNCPSSTECSTWACDESHHCKESKLNGEAPASAQKAGDCSKINCDHGRIDIQFDSDDLPPASDDCHTFVCMTMNAGTEQPKGLGSACSYAGGKGYCDALGKCGPCYTIGINADCSLPGSPVEACYTTPEGHFACTHCNNNLLDSGEVGPDCGGICDTSGLGKKCGLAVDCSKDADCMTGACVAGICCSEACGGPCKSCTGGFLGRGTCSNLPTGKTDQACSAKGFVCVQDTGTCLGRKGTPCDSTDPNRCMSANCESGMCAPSTTGEPCVDDTDCATQPKKLNCNSDHICK